MNSKIIILAVLFVLAGVGQVSGVGISSCTDITSSGTYILTQDITNSGNSICIGIYANNTVFNGQGYTIDGIDADTYNNEGAIVVGNASYDYINVNITNVVITDWEHGINVIGGCTTGSDCTPELYISNITAWSNAVGIELSGSYVQVNDSNISYNTDIGIYADNSGSYSNISYNIIDNNTNYGMFFEGSISGVVISNITAFNNTIRNNGIAGLYISWGGAGVTSASLNHDVYDNYFSNILNVKFSPSSYSYLNDWNTTKTPGTNIVSGPYLGGNFWAYPNGTGFSETCTDEDRDGICDSNYTLASGNVDYLPLSLNFTADSTPPTINITSPPNDTITDTTPDLNFTVSELTNTTYNWDGEGNITGCKNCTSYNTTYGENNGSDTNLTALWHMNENYGTTAYDDASNNDGAISGATWSAGRFGPALGFDGTNNFVNVSDSQSLDLNGAFTLTAWIYSTNSTDNQAIIYKIDKSPAWHGYHFNLMKGANSMKLKCMSHNTTSSGDWGNIKSDDPLTINQWHFVACVRNTNTGKMELYVDGDQAATPTTDNSLNKDIINDKPLFIGTNGWSAAYFNGTIDEVAIYNRALSKLEIQGLYNKALPVGQHSVTVYANDTAGNLNSTTRWFTVSLNIDISSPQNDTTNDTTPDLNFTISEVSNTTYNWNSEGNISGCRQCTSYSTTYGEYANASEQNLILAMHFNENNGSTAYDDSSNKNGAIYGAAWTSGKFGNALDFDGNDYVRVPDNDSLDFSLTDNFTMMVWFKTSGGSGSRYIFDKSWSSGTQYRAYHLFMTGGKLRFMIHANGTGPGSNISNIKSNDLYNDSQWHHIAIVRNTSADKVFMYIDGAYKKNAADNTVEDSENPGDLTIGSYRGTSGFFNGTVDELVFVKRALGAGEISNIYNKTLSDDQHNVTVYAKDTDGNQNSTTRWFSISNP